MGFSEVMKDQLYGPMENPKYKQYASDIYQSARQFLQVIDDMLSLFQTDAGVIELQKNPTQVQAVINKCLGILSEHITQHKIAIQLKIQDNLPKLLVDETRLEQIVLNLLANAIQLSSHEGEIVIEAKLEQDSLNNTVFALIFKDNGRGLSQDELAALMGEKITDDAPTPRRKPASEMRVGSGLGLPLTRMITAMHQAHLSIDSAPGKGTQITVQFPKERIVFWN
jgi:signal transduction histidine kinase